MNKNFLFGWAKSSLVGLSTVGLSFAQNATNSSAWVLVQSGSPICGPLGLLPVFGGLAMTAGAALSAYNYMSADNEARQKAKAGTEGILVGAGLLALAPTLVGYIFGTTIC